MFWNYIKIALRHFSIHKSDTLINITGLSLGIAATILILLYIQFELSFDDFHQQSKDLYRIAVRHYHEGNIEYDSPLFTPPIGPQMSENFPEVKNFVRLRSPQTAYFSYQNTPLKISRIVYTDSTFLNLFSFAMLAGDPDIALTAPYSIVLTEYTADRIFGQVNPIGQQIKLENSHNYTVTGIVRNPPANSHIKFNALISFSTLYLDRNLYLGWDGGNQYITYLQLHPGVDPVEFERKFPAFMWDRINRKYATINARLEPYLQEFSDIHIWYNPYSESLRTNLSIFALIAFLILVIACINFVNLSTAHAARRNREIGIRKILGATSSHLRLQLLMESLMISFISVVVAWIIVELLFPAYSLLLGKDLMPLSLNNSLHVSSAFLLILLVGFLAGGYPSFYFSARRVIDNIGKSFRNSQTRAPLRNVLVVLQFAVSIALIIFTLLINQQIDYMTTKKLGYQKENILVIPLSTDEIQMRSDLLRNEISILSGVLSVSATSDIPGRGFTSNGYFPQGHQTPMMIHVIDIDENFLNTYDIKLIAGQNFSAERQTDQDHFLINQALARQLGWKDPLNKTIERNGVHQVIGVVDDFNFAPLHTSIQPLILTNKPWRDRFNYLSVRFQGKNIQSMLTEIEDIWTKYSVSAPFEYLFLDENIDGLYVTEQQTEAIFLYFSVLAIVIASLGLYSLTSFVAQQRRKEVGIRKVLGSTTTALTTLLTKEFLILVLIANLIAWPVSWYFAREWLENFAYRIAIHPGFFLFAGMIAFFIAILTISTRAIRTAMTNPAEVLRYE